MRRKCTRWSCRASRRCRWRGRREGDTVMGALTLSLALAAAAAAPQSATVPKTSILVHVTHGPEHPTRAALAFLVARTALEEGHSVTLFLAGDAVQLLRD